MSLVQIKQLSNRSAQPDSAIVFDGTDNTWKKIRHHQVINFSDLDGQGNHVVLHDMEQKYVQFSLYDENDRLVMPDEVLLIDNNTLKISLQSFGNSVNGWNLIIT